MIIILKSFSGNVLAELTDEEIRGKSPSYLAFTPDGKRLISADHSGVSMWDLESRSRLETFHIDLMNQSPLWGTALAPLGDRLVTMAGKTSVKIWDVEKREALHSIYKGSSVSLAISDDGSKLVCADSQHTHNHA